MLSIARLLCITLALASSSSAVADPERPHGSDHDNGHDQPRPAPARPAPSRPAPPRVTVIARPAPPPPRHVVIVERPTVHYHVTAGFDPWVQRVQHSPRDGWVWADGAPDGAGGWYPGSWRPFDARTGYVWEPGYWNGFQYVDGYWRVVQRPSWTFVTGQYQGRTWVAGHWTQ